MAGDDFGRADAEGGVDEVTRLPASPKRWLASSRPWASAPRPAYDGLHVRGVLWGGNLGVVQSLLGTPHWPSVRGGVLFLEDVNEHPYRVERALLQLHQAGVLGRQKAVLLGAFTDYRKSRRWTAATR
jgi:muramoyltetrapeptide carboxypeptidase